MCVAEQELLVAGEIVLDGRGLAREGGAVRIVGSGNAAEVGDVLIQRLLTIQGKIGKATELPLQNAINFPAAYLEPPNFDPQAPAAMNYGAIGRVIGHEISHTFDTEGSAFDRTGRMRNWWKPADLAHFKAAAARLAAQYDTYKPLLLPVSSGMTSFEKCPDIRRVLRLVAAAAGQAMASFLGILQSVTAFAAFSVGCKRVDKPA